jgi:hypothetical protein
VLKFIHLTDRAELVERRVLRFCIAVRTAQIVGKITEEQRKRTIEGGDQKGEESTRKDMG